VLIPNVLFEKAREKERSCQRAAECIGGDGREVEDVSGGLDRRRGLGSEDAEISVPGHALNQSVFIHCASGNTSFPQLFRT
jgi:hypothetical protein